MAFRPLADLEALRRGWRWGEVRPTSWAEPAEVAPERASDLGWARAEPVRSLRWVIQRGLSLPFTRVMADPTVEGREWLRNLDRSVIIAANHVSHADIQLLLYALPDEVRERTVVGAAADYWYERPWLGRVVSLWLNTFPFARTGGAQSVLHHSGQLLKAGWHLLIFPEGTRSPDGRMQEFKAGIGHLAAQSRAPVYPVHVGGSHRILPKGRAIPLPAPVTVRIGPPLQARRGEPSRAFTVRVERAVRELAEGSRCAQVASGEGAAGWADRWRATAPRASRRSRAGSGEAEV
jgi:1-acyl-sn-glycerol-3-phosphate acyltransferase